MALDGFALAFIKHGASITTRGTTKILNRMNDYLLFKYDGKSFLLTAEVDGKCTCIHEIEHEHNRPKSYPNITLGHKLIRLKILSRNASMTKYYEFMDQGNEHETETPSEQSGG